MWTHLSSSTSRQVSPSVHGDDEAGLAQGGRTRGQGSQGQPSAAQRGGSTGVDGACVVLGQCGGGKLLHLR